MKGNDFKMKRERVDELLEKYEKTVIDHYHWLHAHPEVSGQEKETAAYIADTLRQMGLEPVEHVGGFGVTALIHGRKPGRCIGLRADIDALPITECTGLPFASQNPGVMHACGHDAHAAMLLGAALILNEQQDTFDGCVKLIFQPSEENSAESGAKRMIEDGVLENPHVDAIIGQHIDTWCDTGMISTRPGIASAASDRFFITIDGKGSHACGPHKGVDAIVIGAQIVSALQTIVARNVDPYVSAVITIGKFVGGSRYNVLGNHVEMEGTCRNHDLATRDIIARRMEAIVKGIAESMGANCEFRYVRGYSPMINAPEMVEFVREATVEWFGEEKFNIQQKAIMGGEDFSFFQEKVPGVYYRTGCHKAGDPYLSVHNEYLVVDPACFPVGIRVMVTSALNYLEQEK